MYNCFCKLLFICTVCGKWSTYTCSCVDTCDTLTIFMCVGVLVSDYRPHHINNGLLLVWDSAFEGPWTQNYLGQILCFRTNVQAQRALCQLMNVVIQHKVQYVLHQSYSHHVEFLCFFAFCRYAVLKRFMLCNISILGSLKDSAPHCFTDFSLKAHSYYVKKKSFSVKLQRNSYTTPENRTK